MEDENKGQPLDALFLIGGIASIAIGTWWVSPSWCLITIGGIVVAVALLARLGARTNAK